MSVSTPQEYIESLEEPRRSEVRRLDALIRQAMPDLQPVVAHGMLGYGPYHYRYASGREGDACRVALASRKAAITLHVCAALAYDPQMDRFRERLPKATFGVGCVRFKRLADIDESVLRELVQAAGSHRVGESSG